MNLIDLLMERDAEFTLGNRILRGEIEQFGKNAGERYFIVFKKGRKTPLVETVCEDEAARYLIGDKP